MQSQHADPAGDPLREVIPVEELEQEKVFESDNDLIHVIYENGDFRPDLQDNMSRWNIVSCGFDYHLLAVLGPQSSGKSTLLNGLFGTSFPTLQAEEGMFQCTKGIWMGKASEAPIIVLDVEGVDSRERGEEDLGFERKTSLFSLVIAQTLIINMWFQDVSRYKAANFGLLRTVMELNLQLFQTEKRGKALLFFVIRDHVPETTALEKLIPQIMSSLEKCWSAIQKPEAFADSQMTDFFNFDFVGLPHKALRPNEFTRDVLALKDRFSNPENDQYVWKASKSEIPADGLAAYAQSIWEAVRSNRDLDLPSQKEMLAMFRCDELMASALEAFHTSIAPLRQTIVQMGNVADNLGKQLDESVVSALGVYDEPASRYFADVVDRKRVELMERFASELKDVFTCQVALLRQRSVKQFKARMKAAFASPNLSETFASIVTQLSASEIQAFDVAVSESVVSIEGIEWSAAGDRKQLVKAIEEAIELERTAQLTKAEQQVQDGFKKDFGKVLKQYVADGKDNMWVYLREEYEGKCAETNAKVDALLEAFSPDPETGEALKFNIQAFYLEALQSLLVTESRQLTYRMEKRFDSVFKYDERGVLREWKPESPLNELFADALDGAKKLLDLTSVMRISTEHDDLSWYSEDMKLRRVPEELIVLTRAQCDDYEEKFKRYADNACYQARVACEHSRLRGSSMYFLAIIIAILGFNEFMWLLSNPFMLVLLLLMGGIVFVGWKMGMAPIVMPTIRLAFKQLLSQLMSFVNGLSGDQPQPPPQQGGSDRPKVD